MADKKTFWQHIVDVAKKIYKNQKVRAQIYSFVKTYATVFIALYLKGTTEGAAEGGDIMLLNMAVIAPAAKWSFISVLRNIYKITTEK